MSAGHGFEAAGRRSVHRAGFSAPCLLLLLTACGGDSTGPPPPPPAPAAAVKLAIVSAPNLDVVSGGTIAPAPEVELRDASNQAVAQAGVTITATIADATLGGTTSAQTTSSGRVTLAGMTASGTNGVHALVFSASGLTVATAALTIRAGAVSGMTAQSLVLQNGLAGAPAPSAPSVRLVDAQGNPVEGTVVQFAVRAGGGGLSETAPTTDANGMATLSSWTLGTAPGLNEVAATAAGDTIVFRAGAAAVAPASLASSSINPQTVMLGQELGAQPAVRASDGGGAPVAGLLVVFGSGTPSGLIDDSVSVSDAGGIATAHHWRLLIPGSHMLVAAVPSTALPSLRFDAKAIRSGVITGLGTDNQVSRVSTVAPEAPAVLVTSDSVPVLGLSVTFAVTAGGGSLGTSTAVTDKDGIARVSSWTLGATPGRNEVTATAPGFIPGSVAYHAFGVLSTPVSLAIVAGDSQTAAILTPVPVTPTVRVSDAGGNPVVGYPVAFAPYAGTIVKSMAVTDGNGIASSGTWTMPKQCPTPMILTASAPALAGSPQLFHANCTVGPPFAAIKGADSLRRPAGSMLPGEPSIIVIDAGGARLPGVPVTVAVTRGSGSVVAANVTDTDGRWEAASWTLDTTAGDNELTVTVASLPPVTFHAFGFGGSPTSMELVGGPVASAPVYSAVPTVIHLTDRYGNDSPNETVSFVASAGSRTLPAVGSRSSDSLGVVGISWRLGSTPGTYSLTATLAGNPALSRTFTTTAVGVTSPFQPEVRYIGSPSTAMQAAVTGALARWRGIITADIPDAMIAQDSGDCFTTEPAISETVDDIVIYIEVVPLDGVGGVLGAAGPCIIRSGSGLPALGYMQLDSADVDQLASSGELGDIVLHEMGHILGIGTLWDWHHFVSASGSGDPRYAIAAGLSGYHDIGGLAASIPLENTGGSGTREAHWRETTFGWELMTGYIATPENPLSRMTVGALQDLGYTVDYGRADYMMMTESRRAELRAPGRKLNEVRLPSPIVVMDAGGRVVGRRARLSQP